MKRALFVTFLLGLAMSSVTAQEAAKAVPKHYKVAEIGASAVSPDGRFLSYVDGNTDEVFVRDLKTGENRRLTNKGAEPGAGGAGCSTISPDGMQIAYNWLNKDGFRELRIIGLDGSEHRVLYRNEEIRYIQPQDWAPDGKHILATFFQKDGTYQVVLVSVADGSVRVLKTSRHRWAAMSFSPDGRYVAYDFPQEGLSHRDIFILAVEGGREAALMTDPANDLLLDWTPDGKQVLFVSDRTGTWGVWVIEVADGKPLGSPELVKPDVGPIMRGLGFTQDGSYYYGVSAWVNDVYLTTLDPATGKLQPPKKLVSHVGFDTSVEWSPDGQYLAYTWGSGWVPDPFVLGVRSVATGKERRLPLKMTRFGSHAFQPHWSPDGRFLLAQGRDLSFRQGLYRIDAQTGEVTPIVQTKRCVPDCIEWPVWARDGKAIFIRWITGPQSIVARNLETGQEKELYRVVSPARVVHLAVSPDGQQLAFVWWDSKNGSTTLKVMQTVGGEPRELLLIQGYSRMWGSSGQPVIELAWTSDSCHVIYATGEKKFELWRVPAEGGEPQNLALAMEGRTLYGLSVHPDGRRIAFTAGTLRRSEVWVLENFLPPGKHESADLSQWKIAFDSTGEDGYAQIYVMDPDGSNVQRLTHTLGKGTGDVIGNQLPVWSPDGKKIAFHANRDGTSELTPDEREGKPVPFWKRED